MKAKKSLGQNFLINKEKIKKIIRTLDLKEGDVVIEIGPGLGAITNELRIMNNELCEKKKLEIRVVAIEKDRELYEKLKIKFKENKYIEFIEGDALNILPELNSKFIIYNSKFKLVGNIPYYITGYLFRILGELENKPSVIALTIQAEVAERVCSGAGEMNLLAASVQVWADCEIVSYISRKDFNPVPKVDSAVIKLKVKDNKLGIKELEKYYQFIKILFKQPRKTILNNIELGIMNNELRNKGRKEEIKEEIIIKLKELGINPQGRPQNLNVGQIIQLAEIFDES